MNRDEFYLDKHKKIKSVIFNLSQFSNRNLSVKEVFSDSEMNKLRKLSEDLIKQVHELNAGRNIFLDNNQDHKEKK